VGEKVFGKVEEEINGNIGHGKATRGKVGGRIKAIGTARKEFRGGRARGGYFSYPLGKKTWGGMRKNVAAEKGREGRKKYGDARGILSLDGKLFGRI